MLRIALPVPVCFLFAIALLVSNAQATENDASVLSENGQVEVIKDESGAFTLMRNNQPYSVKGVGGFKYLRLLKASGGNSIRTWGIEHLEQTFEGKPLLDAAHELGISVTVGFWVQHERHGFNYEDEASIEQQRARLREAVQKYKDHPALLMWGLGNEMEAFGERQNNPLVWQELNHLAGIIKDLDPHHPVMTVVAGTRQQTIDSIKQYYPRIDILGVNAYGGAAGTGQTLTEMGWDGPYMLTEFGTNGHWEVANTAWGAPIEPDPASKAESFYSIYVLDRDNNVGRSLGSYAFYWGNKQEATATWFGMFLETGEKQPAVDAMSFAWTGKWPANRAPGIRSLDSKFAHKTVKPGAKARATVDAADRENDELRYVWDVRAESTDRRTGGDAEAAPPSFSEAIRSGQGTPRVTFRAPRRAGAYRLFVTVFDGQGGAAAHNVPFYVDK
ncbi:MAG: glycoside hydrolase family 2 TIM barrel-domain containing protein [Gammaproteobacteria bacterium]